MPAMHIQSPEAGLRKCMHLVVPAPDSLRVDGLDIGADGFARHRFVRTRGGFSAWSQDPQESFTM